MTVRSIPRSNLAVTVASPSILTTHGPSPVQAPLQFENHSQAQDGPKQLPECWRRMRLRPQVSRFPHLRGRPLRSDRIREGTWPSPFRPRRMVTTHEPSSGSSRRPTRRIGIHRRDWLSTGTRASSLWEVLTFRENGAAFRRDGFGGEVEYPDKLRRYRFATVPWSLRKPHCRSNHRSIGRTGGLRQGWT